MAVCPVCEKRKGKRTCPAKGAKICAPCCGEHRERTISCPLDCTYLIQAHETERFELTEENYPFPDVKLDDRFLNGNAALIEACGQAFANAARENEGALDGDLRAAADSLIETYKTLSGGIYYESRPESAIAQRIAAAVREAIEEYRRAQTEAAGMTKTSDDDVVRALVFVARVAVTRDNSRPRGRAYLGFLVRQFSPPEETPDTGSPIIVPG